MVHSVLDNKSLITQMNLFCWIKKEKFGFPMGHTKSYWDIRWQNSQKWENCSFEGNKCNPHMLSKHTGLHFSNHYIFLHLQCQFSPPLFKELFFSSKRLKKSNTPQSPRAPMPLSSSIISAESCASGRLHSLTTVDVSPSSPTTATRHFIKAYKDRVNPKQAKLRDKNMWYGVHL